MIIFFDFMNSCERAQDMTCYLWKCPHNQRNETTLLAYLAYLYRCLISSMQVCLLLLIPHAFTVHNLVVCQPALVAIQHASVLIWVRFCAPFACMQLCLVVILICCILSKVFASSARFLHKAQHAMNCSQVQGPRVGKEVNGSAGQLRIGLFIMYHVTKYVMYIRYSVHCTLGTVWCCMSSGNWRVGGRSGHSLSFIAIAS